MGRIFAVKRFEIHDGDGIRTTLFLKGCPLHCLWCHNPEGMTPRPMLSFYEEKCAQCGLCAQVCPAGAHVLNEGGRHVLRRDLCRLCGRCAETCAHDALRFYGQEVTPRQILPVLLEDEPFYAASGGVTLSGGEPLMQVDFCAELLKLLKERKINTAVDTCGMAPGSALEAVIPWTDQFLFDIKAVDSRLHKRLTGCDNQQIIENLRYLSRRGARIEVRIPLVPGLNDAEIPAIGRLLRDMPGVERVKVLGYHNLAKDKYASLEMSFPMGDHPPARVEEVHSAVRLLCGMGIRATE